MSVKDEAGKIYGLLTVLGEHPERRRGLACWVVRCECGVEKVITGAMLRSGDAKSCGCQNPIGKSWAGKTPPRARHGQSHTKLYYVWQGIKARCLRPGHTSFPNYGGRGISICDEWRGSFEAFASWAHRHGYAEGKSIERIDPDGDYEPGNCTWVDALAQGKTRRNSRLYDFRGMRLTARSIADMTGADYELLRGRLKIGWSAERAVTTPAMWRR